MAYFTALVHAPGQADPVEEFEHRHGCVTADAGRLAEVPDGQEFCRAIRCDALRLGREAGRCFRQ